MTPLSIGQQTKCTIPKLLICQTPMLSSQGNRARNVLHIVLVRSILDERERHDATTAETSPTLASCKGFPLPACQYIPRVYGCICAFSVPFAVSSLDHDH